MRKRWGAAVKAASNINDYNRKFHFTAMLRCNKAQDLMV